MRSRISLSMVVVALFSATVSGCSTSPTREQVHIGTGAAIGGVLGHVVTDGSVLGTAGGALAGGVVGNEVSKSRK